MEPVAPVNGKSISFTLTVAKEPPRQVTWCLQKLRALYPLVPVTVIQDGLENNGFEAISRNFSCRFVQGERLKTLAKGALWWERFFQESIKDNADIVFKIDADTYFHRRFKFLPDALFFGSVRNTNPPHIQGGCQGFNTILAKRVLHCGILKEQSYCDPAKWTWDSIYADWCRSTDYLSTDWTITKVMLELGIKPVNWTEVNSHYRDEPKNPDKQFAITHPHKLTRLIRQRIAVVTMHTPEISDYANISLINKAKYCDRHHYDLIVSPVSLDESRPPAWSKIKLLQRHLASYDWVFWADADSIIMNPFIRLERFVDPDFELIITADKFGMNSGMFFLKNAATSAQFLNLVYDQSQFVNHDFWEQAAIHHLFNTQQAVIRPRVLPQREFNSYLANYQPGDFIIHFAGKIPKVQATKMFFQIAEGRERFTDQTVQKILPWFRNKPHPSNRFPTQRFRAPSQFL